MAIAEAPAKSLSDPDIKARIQQLRQTNNFTNWIYLAGVYLYLAAVIGGAIAFFEYRQDLDLSWWWNLPVTAFAVILIGAGQHQMSGLAHEGSHHILFKGRYLNDLASDLFTMFPLYSSIYHYRLQHLAHHQFVNDPDRDPDVSQLKSSGHWLNFPVSRADAIRAFVRQIWPTRLIRFMRIRAQYNATGTDKNPYAIKGKKPSKTAVRIGLLYLAILVPLLTTLFYLADSSLMLIVPFGLWIAVSILYLRLPAEKFHQTRLHPVIPPRYSSILRIGFITTIFSGLTYLTRSTGAPVVGYYLILWIVPIFTSFSFFMILRQIVQHGNGGRGWLTNTRTFLVARAIRFAVFPMGQDYHLPHHLFATVPHYRLKKLHAALMECAEYREEAVVVEGYFQPPRQPASRPTVIDVLGPNFSGQHKAVFIDNEVIASDRFEEPEAVAAEAALSRGNVA